MNERQAEQLMGLYDTLTDLHNHAANTDPQLWRVSNAQAQCKWLIVSLLTTKEEVQ